MKKIQNQRLGGWLPENKELQSKWVNDILNIVNGTAEDTICGIMENAVQGYSTKAPYVFQHPEVVELKKLIDTDPKLHLLAEQMIDQALEYDENDPTGSPQITSYESMFRMIDYIISRAPEYVPPEEKAKRALIGFPINAILDWCMGTQAGYAFFLDERVNKHFEKILKAWCRYLSSEESAYVLNNKENEGWLCKSALEELHMEQYIYNSSEEHYGFKSWNDFFTRKFKPDSRPIADADKDPYVITNACESQPYKISTNVQKDTKFWLKSQPYSLEYMLNHDESADLFVGGTVYQAFLSATRYHRWHSSVDGTVVRCFNVPGTYYAEVNTYPYDGAGPNNSQGYITHVAARAVILIESDNPDIGLMAFIAVGMAEVSSCVISVKEGQHLNKGDELGYFQFGGSTHCLIFQKDVIDRFVQDAIPAEDFNTSSLIKLNTRLAIVKRKSADK